MSELELGAARMRLPQTWEDFCTICGDGVRREREKGGSNGGGGGRGRDGGRGGQVRGSRSERVTCMLDREHLVCMQPTSPNPVKASLPWTLIDMKTNKKNSPHPAVSSPSSGHPKWSGLPLSSPGRDERDGRAEIGTCLVCSVDWKRWRWLWRGK
jgi:hypothetical protein